MGRIENVEKVFHAAALFSIVFFDDYKVNECKNFAIRADFIEDYVAEKIKAHLFDDAFCQKLISEIEFHLSGDVDSFTQIKSELEKELAEVKLTIKEALKEKFLKKREEDIVDEIVAEETEKRIALEARIETINQQLNVHDKTDEIREYVKWLRQNLEKADAEIKSSILQQAVESIVVYSDRIEVFVYLSKPYGTEKRHYNKSLSLEQKKPLFTISEQQFFSENGMSIIAHGVPPHMVGVQGNIYTENGADIISFAIERK